MEAPQKIKSRTIRKSSNSTSAYLSEENENNNFKIYICIFMFIEALFNIAKIWKQPKCPWIHEYIKKMWYGDIYIHYSPITAIPTRQNKTISISLYCLKLENVLGKTVILILFSPLDRNNLFFLFFFLVCCCLPLDWIMRLLLHTFQTLKTLFPCFGIGGPRVLTPAPSHGHCVTLDKILDLLKL